MVFRVVSPSLVVGTEGMAAYTAMPEASRLSASMLTVASRFRRLNFVGSYLSTIEAVGTGSWLSVVQVLLDVSIALLVAIIEFHGGIHRGYRTISSEFFFVKRYTQSHLNTLIRKD